MKEEKRTPLKKLIKLFSHPFFSSLVFQESVPYDEKSRVPLFCFCRVCQYLGIDFRQLRADVHDDGGPAVSPTRKGGTLIISTGLTAGNDRHDLGQAVITVEKERKRVAHEQ